MNGADREVDQMVVELDPVVAQRQVVDRPFDRGLRLVVQVHDVYVTDQFLGIVVLKVLHLKNTTNPGLVNTGRLRQGYVLASFKTQVR